MEITNGEIVMNRTNERKKRKRKKERKKEKLLVRVRKLQRGQRVFRARRDSSPHPRFHASLLRLRRVDHISRWSVRNWIRLIARSRRREKKERGEGGKLRSFSPRSYFFPLCSILEGIVLKISWHWRDTRLCLISRPTLLHPIDNGTLNRLSSFYHPSLSLLALGPRKGRSYVSLTFFLITPINFPSVGTEKDR